MYGNQVRRISQLRLEIDTHLAQLILQVDYFCFSVLKNTTDVKVSLALPSTTRARVNLGPAEKRPETGKQVTTRKTRTTGNTASR